MKLSFTRLGQNDALILLTDFNRYFVPALSERDIELEAYAVKLSHYGYFILVQANSDDFFGGYDGFIAYYLNPDSHFAYISLICVKTACQHKGIGYIMLEKLVLSLGPEYEKLMLEVRKDNYQGLKFYLRNGFIEKEDRGEKVLMEKRL